jgi:hypothetical protein
MYKIPVSSGALSLVWQARYNVRKIMFIIQLLQITGCSPIFHHLEWGLSFPSGDMK